MHLLPSPARLAPRARCLVPAAAALLLQAGAWSADLPAGQALAKDKGCLRCHDVVRHYVGPAFQQVADRYRTDQGAAERLAGRIRQGSVGEWGRVIMPRQPQVSPGEAAVLAAWITGLPPQTPR